MTNRQLEALGVFAVIAAMGCGDSTGGEAMNGDLGPDGPGVAPDGGDGGGAGPCAGAACGGDLVGAWDVSDLCVDAEEVTDCGTPPPATPGSIVYRDVVVSGTFDFVSDGSFTLDLTLTATVELTLPADCDVTCEDYWSLEFGTTPNCTTGAEGCSCSEAATYTSGKSGTWSASGSSVEFTGIGGVFGDPVGYCVDGTGLWLQAGKFRYILERP